MKSSFYCLLFLTFFTTLLLIKANNDHIIYNDENEKKENPNLIKSKIEEINLSEGPLYEDVDEEVPENMKRAILRYSGGLYGKRAMRYSGGLYGRKKRSRGILLIPLQESQQYMDSQPVYNGEYQGTRNRRALLIKRTQNRIVNRAMPMNGGLFGR
uniref:Uncharacterized protein n=1 Tax=Parastrongyloides trichosuri TaxID=131310 RepID=A0A0N5A1X6_PARTI